MRSAAHHRFALLVATALLFTMGPGSAAAEPDLRADRYGTAALVALGAFPDGADVAILASGENFPDALAAAPLAAFYDAPILLTRRTSVPADTRETLAELGVGDVIVIGGPTAIDNASLNVLRADYQVSRTSGPDRYGTAAVAALEAFPDGAHVAILATGENYPDALAAAPLAAFYDAPILLTRRTSVPADTREALADLGVGDVIVIGGPAAVDNASLNVLRADYQVSRTSGPDRYGTAAVAALEAFPDGADVAILATGENYPDALAAAPLAAFYDAPILLTRRTSVPMDTREALADLGVGDVIVIGGSAAVDNASLDVLRADYQVSRVAGGG